MDKEDIGRLAYSITNEYDTDNEIKKVHAELILNLLPRLEEISAASDSELSAQEALRVYESLPVADYGEWQQELAEGPEIVREEVSNDNGEQ